MTDLVRTDLYYGNKHDRELFISFPNNIADITQPGGETEQLYNDLSFQHSQLGGHQSRPVRRNTGGQGRGQG